MIGPLWETLSTLILVLGITVVYSSIFTGTVNKETVAFIGLGVATWSLVTSFFIDGATLFIDSAGLLKNSSIKRSLIVKRKLCEILIIFAHISLLFFVGIVAGVYEFELNNLFFVPGMILVLAFGHQIIVVMSYICAWFRDLIMITRNLLQLMFFVTPIFWNPDVIKSERVFLVEYNPFHHLIALLREPLLGNVPTLNSYMWVLGLIIVGWFLAQLVRVNFSKNIAMVL